MKIAFITADGETISKHFGRAPYYLVVTIKDGQVVHREMRSKPGHSQFVEQDEGDYQHGEQHSFTPAFHSRHVNMTQAIADCQVLICAGMGTGAYESMEMLNIRPIVTDQHDIETVLQLYLMGKLEDRKDLLD